MTPADRLAALEAAYLAARDARDRLDVARAIGEPADPAGLETRASEASAMVHAGLGDFDAAAVDALGDDDRRAFVLMRDGMAEADEHGLPVTV